MDRSLRVLVLVVSAVVLALEVAHVRLLSYVTDPRLVYGAISVALAGLGGASLIVALRPSLARGEPETIARRVSVHAAACGASIVVSAILLARISRHFSVASVGDVITKALPILAVVGAPYVPGGLAITIALTASSTNSGARGIHLTYAASLLGSALGCFVPLALLRPLGLEALLVVLGAVSGAFATYAALRARAPTSIVMTCASLALGGLVVAPFASRLMPFEPDPHDLLGLATATYLRTHPSTPPTWRPVRDRASWDPVSRVEVWTFPGDFGTLNGTVPIKLVTQDGGAGTILIAFGPPPSNPVPRAAWADHSVYGAGYLVKPDAPRVLVVGLGGGVDVVTALHHGARHVTGVEINGSIVDVSSREFDAFQGGVLSRPDVTVVHGDGRSFIERAQRRGERWSLIQMSGADTYSAGTAGAFMFSESYLYTVDAFRRYIATLDDDGVLALIRFGPESLRAVISEAIALQDLGVRDPSRHFVVLRQGICFGIVLSRKPIDEAALRRVLAGIVASTKNPRPSLPMWDAMGFGIDEPLRLEYAPGVTKGSTYELALEALETGGRARLDDVLSRLPLDYSPTTDDRPFFFQFLRPKDWSRLSEIKGPEEFLAEGLRGYLRLLVGFIVLAGISLILPPLLARGRARWPSGMVAITLYFAALGIGYMLVELAIVQRTVLLLGHPSSSVAVTLAALLLGSGIGSALSGRPRLRERPKRTLIGAVLAIAVGILASELLLRPVSDALLPQPMLVRVVALLVMVVPLGVPMGIPFPLAWSLLHDRCDEESAGTAVAWGLGVNGFSSVLASLLAVPAAMLGGFRSVMLCAVGLYLLAGLLGVRRLASDP